LLACAGIFGCTAAWSEQYRVTFEGPSALREIAARHSDLARFQSTTDVSVAELTRLINEAPAQLSRLFATEGFFNPVVRVEREASGGVPQIRVVIEAGSQTIVDRVNVNAVGAIADENAQNDRPNRADDVRRQWLLPVGAPFRQSAWDDAKSALLTSLWIDRYPAARIVNSEAQIAADDNRARLLVEYDSGPLFRYGELQVSGLARVPRSAVDNLSAIRPGQPYTQKDLLDLQDRLLGSGLFDAASVHIESDPEFAGAVPVEVRLRERAAQTLVLGLGYSTLAGPRATVEHNLQRLFGLEWSVRSSVKVARDDRTIATEFLSYPQPNFYRNLVAANISRFDTAGLVINQQQLRAGRRYDADRITRLYYVAAIRDATTTTEPLSGNAILGNYEWRYLSVDSPVIPTRGFSLTAQGGGGVRFGEVNSGQPFARALGRISLYQPLGAQWFAQLRFQAGAVLSGKDAGIPQSLLFRAGGVDSVRGYSYQSLGITGPGYVSGGQFLMTAGAELTRTIIADWQGALFVDAGDASRRLADWRAKAGYGVGVRWRSPVGPLKADVSYGQAIRRFRLDVSVGVTF
jgi:translocation and assembly module TamA